MWNVLEQYLKRTLQKTMRIIWQDRRTNSRVLDEAHMTNIDTIIM